jgi:hypothetical protein
LLRELVPDTPIPQPEIERPAEPRVESPTPDAARVARRASGSVPTQRRVPEESRLRQASPRVAAMEARAVERAAPNSNPPSPERTLRESSENLQSRIAPANAATREESLLLADSETSRAARQRPRPAATQPLDRPAPTVGEEIRRRRLVGPRHRGGSRRIETYARPNPGLRLVPSEASRFRPRRWRSPTRRPSPRRAGRRLEAAWRFPPRRPSSAPRNRRRPAREPPRPARRISPSVRPAPRPGSEAAAQRDGRNLPLSALWLSRGLPGRAAARRRCRTRHPSFRLRVRRRPPRKVLEESSWRSRRERLLAPPVGGRSPYRSGRPRWAPVPGATWERRIGFRR